MRGVPAKVGLPVGDGARLELVLHFRVERRLGHVDHPGVGESAGLPVGRPAERRCHRDQFGARHFVELLIGVAEFHLRERCLRERGLDFHYGLRLRLRRRRRIAQKFEHAGHVRQVLSARFLALRVGLGVVIAIGQSEAAGRSEGDFLLGVGEILRGAEPEDRVAACRPQMHARQNWRQVLQGIQAGDGVHRGLERRGSGLLHGWFVHACAKEIADLLFVRGSCRRGFRGLFEYSPEVLQVLLRHLAVDAPPRLVGWNRIQFVPIAAGEAPEIHAGVHPAIDECGFQAGSIRQRGERTILRVKARRNQCQGERQLHAPQGITRWPIVP